MVNRCLTLLLSVTLAHDSVYQVQLLEVFHNWESFGVDGFWIVASIELSQFLSLTRLVNVNETCVQNLANSCRALALKSHLCRILVPIDKVRAAIVSRVAHVAK